MKRTLRFLLAALSVFSGCASKAETDASNDAPIDASSDSAVVDAFDAPTDTSSRPDVQVLDQPAPVQRVRRTGGGAVAITQDDRFMVAANRFANTISVHEFDRTRATPTFLRTTSIMVPNAEPWAVVLGADDNTAYVVLRRTQEVVVVEQLRNAPRIAQRVRVGSEPTGIAITPSGATLFVANWGEGTITEVRTSTASVARTIEVNSALVRTGALGTVEARPALAHPRALLVTDNGDNSDADEEVYATEFFSQQRTDTLPSDDSVFDVGQQGFVYRFRVGTGEVFAPISIASVADTGFRDMLGTPPNLMPQMTGCFPNQLSAIAIDHQRVYVSAMCASPRGPLGLIGGSPNASGFKTQMHPALFVIDTNTHTEKTEERVLLDRAWQQLYDETTTPDDASRRMPLLPTAMSFAGANHTLLVAAYGADAVFRLRFTESGALALVGDDARRRHFTALSPGGLVAAGESPIGITHAYNSAGNFPFAFALNASSRNLSVIDTNTHTVLTVLPTADPPTAAETSSNNGRRAFISGLDRWSYQGQAWSSCEGCHPDGLSDHVTWFSVRGPRQTIALDGTFDARGGQRILNWTANADEVHDFEQFVRNQAGGVGAIVHASSTPPAASDRIVFEGTTAPLGTMRTDRSQAGLDGSARSLMPDTTSTPRSVRRDWLDIEAYVQSIRTPRAPTTLDAALVVEGRALFLQHNCAGCHGGEQWTISRRFWTPNSTNNDAMGRLQTTEYTLPSLAPLPLHPFVDPASRTATLRLNEAAMLAGNDQINCVLRAVGTFPAALGARQLGVAPMGVPVREVRANMSSAAQGNSGFNPPSLLGLATGAPYFHAGNARTIEETFSVLFQVHTRALSAGFLIGPSDAQQLRALTAFLLSIDGDTAAAPSNGGTLGFNPIFCPTEL